MRWSPPALSQLPSPARGSLTIASMAKSAEQSRWCLTSTSASCCRTGLSTRCLGRLQKLDAPTSTDMDQQIFSHQRHRTEASGRRARPSQSGVILLYAPSWGPRQRPSRLSTFWSISSESSPSANDFTLTDHDGFPEAEEDQTYVIGKHLDPLPDRERSWLSLPGPPKPTMLFRESMKLPTRKPYYLAIAGELLR